MKRKVNATQSKLTTMSEYNTPNLRPPKDEQVFERANRILWKCELGDDAMQLFGRRGQSQYGVDATGIRDSNPNSIVGIQCKLKSHGKKLTEKELIDEVNKALTFKPLLAEYYVCTTADDDGELQRLALELSQKHSQSREIPIKIRVFGWGSLELLITKHREANNAFDPTHTSQGERLEDLGETLASGQEEIHKTLRSITNALSTTNSDAEAMETELDRQISDIANVNVDDPSLGIELLQKLIQAHPDASGRITFRAKANLANFRYMLGETKEAADGLLEAFNHDPENPKAISNKALALLMMQEWTSLQDFSVRALADDPENAALAGYFTQGMAAMPEITVPETHLPVPLLETKEVMVGLGRFYLNRGEARRWHEIADKAYELFPEDALIAEQKADATLDEVLSSSAFEFGYRPSPDQESKVTLAVRLYRERWETIRSQPKGMIEQSLAVPANLMLGLRLLNDSDGALEVGYQAMESLPGNLVISEKVAAALLETGDAQGARQYLEKLNPTPETVMMWFHVHTQLANWAELRKLVSEHFELFPDFEKPIARAADVLASAHLADGEERGRVLSEGLEHAKQHPRALAILAQGARRFELDDLATRCYELAREIAEQRAESFADRHAVAHEAYAHGDWATISSMLYGHIDMAKDSQNLRLLMTALINRYPIREQARHFFEALPNELREKPYFLTGYGVMEANRGDNVAALEALRKSFAASPSLSALVPLLQTLHRLKREDDARSLLESEEVDALDGAPSEQMRLAHILVHYGFSERAIKLGYDALCAAPDNPDLCQKYVGLFLSPGNDLDVSSQYELSTGFWFSLHNDVGATLEGIIGEEVSRPWGNPVNASHPILQRFLGASAGAKIDIEGSYGKVRTWTLGTVQPRWLRAYTDLLENIETRFPDASAIAKVDVSGEDFSEIFEQIKKKAESDQERLEVYKGSQIPLAYAAGKHAAGAVGFADYLLSNDEEIHTATGNLSEIAEVESLLIQGNVDGIVLDAYTAWRASQFKALEWLKELGQPLILPASDLISLKALVELQDASRQGRSMSTSYKDGKFYKEEFTQRERTEIAAWMTQRIEYIEEHCTIEPVTVPDDIPEEFEKLLTIAPSDLIAAGAMAAKGRLLLSDDFPYRALSHQVFGTRSVWLQAAAAIARKRGIIEIEEYAELVKMLAVHRHGKVFFDLPTIVHVFRNDDTPTLFYLKAMCRYLGYEGADGNSHIRIASAFLNLIWATAVTNDPRVPLATGIVIAMMLDHEREDWGLWCAGMIAALEQGPKTHLIQWCQAKSKPLSDALKILASASAKVSSLSQ